MNILLTLLLTTVTIFGDSYSTFDGWLTPASNESWYFAPGHVSRNVKNDVTKVEECWWYQVIERMGWTLERNNSYSGSTVGYFGYQNENYHARSFCTRVENLGEPDVILCCCATNDAWTGEKVGEYKYANITENDMWYFRPAFAKLCMQLKQSYPQARVVFIMNTDMRPETAESMRVICRHYGMELLELQYLDKQEGHPSVKGHKEFADQVVAYLK